MKEKRDINLYIGDIIEAINEVEEYVSEIADAEALANDKKTYRAVLMNFIIIGEAVRNIYEQVRENHPEVEWKDVMSMRNKLTHEYFGVDNQVVWDSIKNNLPELREIIMRIKKGLQ